MSIVSLVIFIAAISLHAMVGAGLADRFLEKDYYLILTFLLTVDITAAIASSISVLRGIDFSKPVGSIRNFHEHVDDIIRTKIPLLAAGYARFVDPIRPVSTGDIFDLSESVKARFSSFYLWMFIFAATFIVIFFNGNNYSNRGIFGILTQTQAGKAVAGVIASYICIWSLTLYSIGRLFSTFANASHRNGI